MKKNSKKFYKSHLDKLTLENSDYRHVLYTGNFLQLVLINLKPGEDIGLETHSKVDQFFKFASGEGSVTVDGKEYPVTVGDLTIVPMGTEHNVTNVSKKENLKFYTIYSPPEHMDGLIQNSKDK
jgi:mannose-6-phosphate isomerase-like protein (cupin superfamily)